jgi:putative transposase
MFLLKGENMDEKLERQLRRKAIRLTLQGVRSKDILQAVSRGRKWLSKWRKRYQQFGWAGISSRSRQPLSRPHQYSPHVRTLVIRVRRYLRQRKVGLIGPKAIQRELRTQRLLRNIPSLATIKRILSEAGLTKRTPRPRPAGYYPRPTAAAEYVLHAMDWTARYLEGGAKVYAFHTLDLQTRACKQTMSTDKTSRSVQLHALEAWKTLGLPDGLQMDNDAAFCGGYKAPRVFGEFLRLCLYLGIEPIFIPVAEPERNGEVERLNGLWGSAFWERRRFSSVTRVKRASPQFETWYSRDYEPPRLNGRTPAQALRFAPRRRLTKRQSRALPDTLPITAGRVHFIRQVGAEGTIALLNEIWPVGKRLAGRYVWATVWTHKRELEIYYRHAPESEVQLVKTYEYAIAEAVVPLLPEFKREHRRRRMCTMW